MQRTKLGNKRNLFGFVYIGFFGCLIVIEPSVITIIIELLSSCKFIYVRLLGLVVRFIIHYRCGVFDVLPFHLLIKSLELLFISSAPPEGVIILCGFAVIDTIVVIVLSIRHL